MMDFHQYPRWKGERATQPRAFLGGQARETPVAPSCDSPPRAALMADRVDWLATHVHWFFS